MSNAVHQYEDKLLEFAYGELPRHEADAVDAHVRGCARCTQALTEIRSVRTAMATLPMEAAPDAGLESLLAYAEQTAKRNAQAAAPVPFWKRYLTPLITVMTVVTVGVFGYQTSQQLDLSPSSAAADKKLDEYSMREKSKESLAKAEPSAAPVEAATPPPALAANTESANVPADDAQGEEDERNRQLGMEGKRAAAPSPEPALKQVVPESKTRRALNTSKSDAKSGSWDLPQQNYSDVGLRGGKLARAEEAKPSPKPMPKAPAPEPKREAPQEEASAPPPPAKAQDKGGGGSVYGLSGGAVGGGLSDVSTADGAPAKDANKIVAQNPAPVTTAPAPAPVASSAYTPDALGSSLPQKKSKKSLGLGGYGSGRGDTSVAQADDALLEKSDALGVDRDVKFAERQAQERRTQSLEQARVMGGRGDRLGEIKAATVALDGATGSQRVEALKRLCDAWEAVGEAERADPYCDALLREFPNSLAAKNVSDRRNQVQRAGPAPAPRSKTANERKAMDAEDSPAKAEPAESKPASAY